MQTEKSNAVPYDISFAIVKYIWGEAFVSCMRYFSKLLSTFIFHRLQWFRIIDVMQMGKLTSPVIKKEPQACYLFLK